MSGPLPTGYTPPEARRDQWAMRDLVAQNLLAELISLHEALCVKLDRDIELAAQEPSGPSSGHVTGTGEHDRMLTRADAVDQAKWERDRTVKAAQQRLRRHVQYYQDRLGVRCTDPAHHHTMVVVDDWRVG